MTFKPESVQEFLILFEERKEKIRYFEGCAHLELLQDKNNAAIYFTYSYWDSETSLNHYRNSELFKDTWMRTKALFLERAEAWTVEQQVIL